MAEDNRYGKYPQYNEDWGQNRDRYEEGSLFNRNRNYGNVNENRYGGRFREDRPYRENFQEGTSDADWRRMNYGDIYHGNVEKREQETNRAIGSRYGNQQYGYDRTGYEEGSYNRWDRMSNRTGMDREEREYATRMPERQFKGKGPRGYNRSDIRILEDICDRLTEDAYIDASDIDVKVDNQEVIISGIVHSREEKRRAEDLIESVSGVRNLQNQLRVENPRNEEPVRNR